MFPNFSKLRKFTIVKMICPDLLGQSDIRMEFSSIDCLFLYVEYLENIRIYFSKKNVTCILSVFRWDVNRSDI